jgi:hypothetical protein
VADPLADQTALEARLGRPLTPAEEARAQALLQGASARVRSYTRQDFTRVDDDTVVLRAQQGEIRLPQRPVLAVTSVVALGAGGAPDVPVVGWQWDGLDIIRAVTDSPVINLPEMWNGDDDGAYPGTYRVTYSHGDGQVPEAVVEVVAAMVLRTLTAPTMLGGVTGETIGPYSYRTEAGAGTAVVLTEDDKRALREAGYRRSTGMTQVRWR